MDNEQVNQALQQGPVLPEDTSKDLPTAAEKRDAAILNKVANGNYGAILEAFPGPFRALVEPDLRRFGRIMDALGPGSDKGVLLREAQTSAAFPYLLGAELHRELMKGYAQIPPLWKEFCEVADLKDFRSHYGIRPSEVGELELVPEAAEYTETDFSEVRWNYTAKKYGRTFSLTMEALKNDDLNAFANLAGKLGQAAVRTLNKLATQKITDNAATTYDSVTLMHATSHGANLTTNALSEANLETGVGVMGKQVDTRSNPLAVEPKVLMVGPVLRLAAMRIAWAQHLQSGSTTAPGVADLNILASLGFRVVSNPFVRSLLSSDTPWYILADPTIYPTIRVGFLDGQQEPELFRAQVGNPLEFTRDVHSWKVRIIFGLVSVDHVGIYGRNT